MKPRVIKESTMVANSPKTATYEVRLIELPGGGGYAICKLSGPSGASKQAESWWREDLLAAEKKFDGIIRQKTTRAKGRVYRDEPHKVENQMNLW